MIERLFTLRNKPSSFLPNHSCRARKTINELVVRRALSPMVARSLCREQPRMSDADCIFHFMILPLYRRNGSFRCRHRHNLLPQVTMRCRARTTTTTTTTPLWRLLPSLVRILLLLLVIKSCVIARKNGQAAAQEQADYDQPTVYGVDVVCI